MRMVFRSALILFLLLVAAPAGAVGLDFGLALGAQLNGHLSGSWDNESTDAGFSLGLELMFEIPIVRLGVGYEFGFPRDLDMNTSDLEYQLLYGIARVDVIGPAYVMARAGYGDFEPTGHYLRSERTIVWGVGLGVNLSGIKLEAMYNDFEIPTGNTSHYTHCSVRMIVEF